MAKDASAMLLAVRDHLNVTAGLMDAILTATTVPEFGESGMAAMCMIAEQRIRKTGARLAEIQEAMRHENASLSSADRGMSA